MFNLIIVFVFTTMNPEGIVSQDSVFHIDTRSFATQEECQQAALDFLLAVPEFNNGTFARTVRSVCVQVPNELPPSVEHESIPDALLIEPESVEQVV